jgi:hypothetical protein
VCGHLEETASRGYQLRNAAEGLNYPILGPRGAVLVAWALSSIFFGALHAGNPNATPLSTFNIVLAGLMLGFGYVLSGQLAIPIGLHLTWNFFQNAVYGLPVSGFGTFGASFLSAEQSGPDLWTGGSFGPEGGLLGPAAMLLGVLLIALWVRLRTGKPSLHLPIAEGRRPGTSDPERETRADPGRSDLLVPELGLQLLDERHLEREDEEVDDRREKGTQRPGEQAPVRLPAARTATRASPTEGKLKETRAPGRR